jgi:hypothetical protein
MSSIVDSLFGGVDNSGQKLQVEANAEARKYIEQQTARAREDAMRYTPRGVDAARDGFRSAFDLATRAAPASMGAMRGGHIRAQEALLAGLPQMQNALMGTPTDMSGLNVSNLGSGAANVIKNTKLPEFMSGPSAQAQQEADNASAAEAGGGMTPEMLQAMLSGNFNGRGFF